MKGIVFYFSGTGNSYAVSKGIVENLTNFELARLIDISEYNIYNYDVIGLVYPVYYIHAPKIVLQKLEKITLHKHQRMFLVLTYGASYGYGASDVRKIVATSNIFLQEFRVKMPGNYILEYGAFPKIIQQAQIQKSKKAIKRIAKAVQDKKTTIVIKPNILARLFKKNGNKVMEFGEIGNQFNTNERCNGCKLCMSICPVSNIKMHGSKLEWLGNCQQCMACIQWCPQNAITHPQIRKNRIRYVHPEVTLQQLWK